MIFCIKYKNPVCKVDVYHIAGVIWICIRIQNTIKDGFIRTEKFFRAVVSICLVLLLFSFFPCEVFAQEATQFIAYNATTGTTEKISEKAVGENTSQQISLPGEGNLKKIEQVYREINALRQENEPSVSTFSIIGLDSRDKVGAEICMPYSRICFLEITWEDGAVSTGTGWMYARDRVATAGHAFMIKIMDGQPPYWFNPDDMMIMRLLVNP